MTSKISPKLVTQLTGKISLLKISQVDTKKDVYDWGMSYFLYNYEVTRLPSKETHFSINE